jgi:hypothetical protein
VETDDSFFDVWPSNAKPTGTASEQSMMETHDDEGSFTAIVSKFGPYVGAGGGSPSVLGD